MAATLRGAVVDAWANRQGVLVSDTPCWAFAGIQVQHHAMASLARAVERDPVRVTGRSCDNGSAPRKTAWDLIRSVYLTDDAPSQARASKP